MKTNRYRNLINFGISPKTLMSLSESEIRALHSSLIEASTQDQRIRQTTYTPSEVTGLKNKNQGLNVNGEVSLKSDGSMVVNQRLESELRESRKKGKNPWAICTAEMGKQFGTPDRSEWTKAQKAKYERCVKGAKVAIKEGRDPSEFILENRIMELVDKKINNANDSLSKGELLRIIERKMSRSGPEIAEPEVKPKTKPKPKETPDKRPSPFKPPKEAPRPKPKGKSRRNWNMYETEEIAEPEVKPKTTPKPKQNPKETPSPFKPPKKAPRPKPKGMGGRREMRENKPSKANNFGLPSWLTFRSLNKLR
jgi:hypothetical protein